MSCNAVCNTKSASCTKCPKMKLEKCQQNTDICIASWTPTYKGTGMLAMCFPLPPQEDRIKYSKICKPWNRNGTYTCLCRRNGCNKVPLLTTTSVPSTTRSPKITSDGLVALSTQKTKSNPYTSGHSKAPSCSVRCIAILCSLLILLLLILGMYVAAKRSSKHRKSFPVNDVSPMKTKKVSAITLLPHSLPELKIKIAEGNKCAVWRGTFSGIDVAVKCFSVEKECLWTNERRIYSNCYVHHKNIAVLVAASNPLTNGGNQIWLATKYCEQGTLQSYLKSHDLSWERLLAMAKDITAGLGFLHKDCLYLGRGHKAAIAHQDLKSKNVFIEGDGTCVIADFGLSLELTKDYSRQLYRDGQVGTVRYMAPEKLEARFDIADPDSFKQIDVYALALILWEMLARCQLGQGQSTCMDYTLPYQDLVGNHPTLAEMIDVVSENGCRPRKPKLLMDKSTPNDVHHLWTTITECWDEDPEARLTADCVSLRLDNLYCKSVLN